MMLHPDIQDKVQADIDDVIGADRLPSLQDRTRMPFTEAVTLESSRMASIVPFAVPHRCTKKFTLRGYTIPANTLCLSNIYAVHMDPNNFPQPEVFRPERFLSEDGRKIRKSDFLIPFGIGVSSITYSFIDCTILTFLVVCRAIKCYMKRVGVLISYFVFDYHSMRIEVQ